MPNPWLNEHKSTAAMNYFLNILLSSSKAAPSHIIITVCRHSTFSVYALTVFCVGRQCFLCNHVKVFCVDSQCFLCRQSKFSVQTVKVFCVGSHSFLCRQSMFSVQAVNVFYIGSLIIGSSIKHNKKCRNIFHEVEKFCLFLSEAQQKRE